MPFVIGPCGGSWGIVGGTTCPTNGCTVRLAHDLLSAKSGVANSSYMATWLASHRMILATRFSLYKTTLGEGGLWDDPGSRSLGRSIKPVMKSLEWAGGLP